MQTTKPSRKLSSRISKDWSRNLQGSFGHPVFSYFGYSRPLKHSNLFFPYFSSHPFFSLPKLESRNRISPYFISISAAITLLSWRVAISLT